MLGLFCGMALLIIIGIKHVFLYINICWTPRVVLKGEGFNDPEGSSRC